eukprot:TRINITY_DN3729_c0_g1_i9.p2 TRINITY_DN3729_c0_g1~~TRINITY_DN3729_c0_g1_i9.p2  ORF type:complete len:113 (-),score=1.87 TRINITY_DN3729_c0_g1_i9:83-421(-)
MVFCRSGSCQGFVLDMLVAIYYLNIFGYFVKSSALVFLCSNPSYISFSLVQNHVNRLNQLAVIVKLVKDTWGCKLSFFFGTQHKYQIKLYSIKGKRCCTIVLEMQKIGRAHV